MKKTTLSLLMIGAAALSTNAIAKTCPLKVSNEFALWADVYLASMGHCDKIVFKKNAYITVDPDFPIVYTGENKLTIVGKGATVDGSLVGEVTPAIDDEGRDTLISDDATLMFNTAADISINNLSVVDSKTRGVVVNVPQDAEGQDIFVELTKVTIADSALFGLHIDDNQNEFDEGDAGSAIGIKLDVTKSSFVGNGVGAIDYDGVRVDERGEGGIEATFFATHIDENGADGIELDEAGEGDIDVLMVGATMNANGFQNPEDLDDGFDIDEADEGSINVTIVNAKVNENLDEGLDFDEEGEGDINLTLRNVVANENLDEGIKADEEDAGNIESSFTKVKVNGGIDDDGIQFTEIGTGDINASFVKVEANDNNKYGIKIEQWLVEDETDDSTTGSVQLKAVTLSGNGKGDDVKTHGVDVK